MRAMHPYRRQDFHFELPEALIARHPAQERSASRLLVLGERLEDRQFRDLPDYLRPGDLLVFNDTRVMPARLYGHKRTGGKIELLIERVLAAREALAHVRANRAPKPGTELLIEGQVPVTVLGREHDLFRLRLDEASDDWSGIMERFGHMPLPPYIDRPDEQTDAERYQTIYGRREGAVAAPTAGLHFDEPLLETLRAQGIEFGYVTLHVGAGTFKPVQVEDIREHRMHSEWIEVSPELVQQVAATRERGGRVVAVGTTAVRCLESASQSGQLRPMQGETDIFITPGYRFRQVDLLITNFHLPESTLIMLVSAFAGHARTMAAYRHAVEQGYRFFSYGDAMLVYPEKDDAV